MTGIRTITITIDDDDPSLQSVTTALTGDWPEGFEPSLFSLIGRNGDVEILNSDSWAVGDVQNAFRGLGHALSNAGPEIEHHEEA
jgi:hypothetical protein